MRDWIVALLWVLVSFPSCDLIPEPQPPPDPVATGGTVQATGGAGGSAGATQEATGGTTEPTARCQFVELRSEARQEKETAAKVINGQPADMGQYPGVCALRNASGSARCTAELLAPEWLLTAGHCQPEPGQIVICGCPDIRNANCQLQTVVMGYVHELYEDWAEGHDLALARVQQPFLGLETVTLSDSAYLGEAHVAGFGRTCSTCSTSPQLLEADLTLISNTACSAWYPGSITSSMMCGLGAGKDAAPGDSGGFLGQLVNGAMVQVGVVSWGRSCTAADPGGNPTGTCVGVYASLAGEVDGIRSCIGGQ